MKTYRRIEITASSRRVSVTSGEFKRMSFDEPYPPVAGDMSLRDAEAGKAIDLESADGQSVLAEVVHLLQQRQTTQMCEVKRLCADTIAPWQRFRRWRGYVQLPRLSRFISRLLNSANRTKGG